MPVPASSSRKNALLDTLCSQYPVFAETRPLALGIHKDLLARNPEIDPAQLRQALRLHTASTRYLKGLAAATVRFDLDGQATGEVTEAQREAASTMLKERFAKTAERRRAEVQAEADAKAIRERQEKLQKLAAKFNPR